MDPWVPIAAVSIQDPASSDENKSAPVRISGSLWSLLHPPITNTTTTTAKSLVSIAFAESPSIPLFSEYSSLDSVCFFVSTYTHLQLLFNISFFLLTVFNTRKRALLCLCSVQSYQKIWPFRVFMHCCFSYSSCATNTCLSSFAI